MPDAFLEYLRLFLSLYKLDANGKNDSAEADIIRDKMDTPYKLLNEKQIDLIKRLSCALSSK